MSRHLACVLLCLAAQTLLVTQVEGQIIRRLRERRAAAQASAAAPGDPAVAPLPRLRGFLARRLRAQEDLVAQEVNQPTPASPEGIRPEPPTRNLAARRLGSGLRQATATEKPAIPSFSISDLAAMDVNGLQSALANVEGALQNDLNRFSSANSWQGFLRLPEGVVDEQAIDPAALEVSLDRFNRVANNPSFSQISSLSSFVQTRGLLGELANRTVGPKLVNAAVASESSYPRDEVERPAEQLPAPQAESSPVRPARENEGERSILVRSE